MPQDFTPAQLQKINQILDQRAKEMRYNPSYTNITHNGIDGPILSYVQLNKAFLCVAVTTNGATAVNVFNAFGSPYNGTITGVFLVAQDTTAGNITIKNAASTVVTIAKGTVSGAMVGGVTLANTTLKRGQAVTAVSSSAGNATVFITFSVTS